MSHLAYKYSQHIGQPMNDQSAQSHNRLNPTSQSHQQTPVQQYADQSSYGWSKQQQPAYGSGDAYTYPQRSQTPYNNSNTVAAPNTYHATAAQPQASPPALDSLAYVSGLESAGLNSRGNQQGGSVPAGYNMARQQAPERVTSPYGQNQAKDSYHVNRPTSAASRPSRQQQGHKSSHPSLNLAASAMVALQDTSSGYPSRGLPYSPYASSPNTTAALTSQRTPQSPSIPLSHPDSNPQNQGSENNPRLSTSVGGRASQGITPQYSPSRWDAPQQSHSRIPSSQGYGLSNSHLTSTTGAMNHSTIDVSAGFSRSSQDQTHNYQNSNTPQQQQQANGHDVNSARLSTNNKHSTYGQSQEAHSTDMQSYQNQMSPTQNSIPSFIDPSQVYNPYQQEYEKRKAAEEAEAEQRRVAAEQMEKEAQPSVFTESVPVHGKKEKKKRSRKSEPNPKPGAKADNRRSSRGSVDAALQAAAVLASGMTSDNAGGHTDDDLEMKMMLEKMKQLKSKDPFKFQRLWGKLTQENEDTPKPSSVVEPAATPQQAPSTKTKSDSKSGLRKASQKAFQYVPPEENKANLPDLGKFPVQRRMRYKSRKTDLLDTSPADGFMNVDEPAQSSSYASPYRQDVTSQNSIASPKQAQASFGGEFKFPTPENLRFQSPVRTGSPYVSLTSVSYVRQVPVNQPLQDQTSGNTPVPRPPPTVWPQAKRRALAEAAVRTLLLNPANGNKGLTTELILTLLDQNPSYPELCEKLESRGMLLHRGNFAKSLLYSVPDLTSSSTEASTGNNAIVSSNTRALKLQPSAAEPGAQAVAQLNTQVDLSNFTRSPTIAKAEPGQFSKRKPIMVPGGQIVPGPPSTTQRHKSKNQSPSVQVASSGPKDAMARKRNFSDIVDLTQSVDSDDEAEEELPPAKEARTEDPNLDPQLFNPKLFQSAPGPLTLLSDLPMRSTSSQTGSQDKGKAQEEIIRRGAVKGNAYLVKPVNKTDALRKSFYNPLTIARDVLLASGRHPSEDPLNAHLARLTKRLPQINFEADLSTLRWDKIDPGGPEVVLDESTQIPSNQRFSVASYSQELTATQAQLVRLAHKQRAKRTEAQPPQQSSLRNVIDLHSDRDTKSPIVEIVTPRVFSPPAKQTPPATMRPTSTPDSGSLPKKRGRPPGSRNKAPTGSTLQQVAREHQPHAPRPGRPPKAAPKQRSPLPQPPSYSVYSCHWSGCDAQLHNLETFKKHFVKVHEYDDTVKDNRCLWTGCGVEVEAYEKPSNSYKKVVKRQEFSDRKSWMDHILSQHLDPLGWSLGSGPSVQTNDPFTVAPYLLDSTGHLVTPIIKPDSGRPRDTMHIVKPTLADKKINKEGLVKYNKLHGKDTPQEKAKEVLRAMEAKKARIGALIDKGGCTMVNRDNRHILKVEGEVKVIKVDNEWLYEGRDEEPMVDTPPNHEVMDTEEPDPEPEIMETVDESDEF